MGRALAALTLAACALTAVVRARPAGAQPGAVPSPAAPASAAAGAPRADTTAAVLARRAVPAWFADAKLGLFINWGPYSIPGWAPVSGPVNEVLARRGWQYWFANNAYAEWYGNSMRLPGPTREHHARTWGASFPYDSFATRFGREAARVDLRAWAAFAGDVGARYVVLDVKHHDGYKLWPSENRNPRRADWQVARDLPAELAAATRARGLRFGVYYSGGLDWTFEPRPIADLPDLAAAVPRDSAYAAYVDRDYRELIARYRPDVLWNDIAYPARARPHALFADYYAARPEGVVNDRWAAAPGAPAHADFATPEYTTFARVRDAKWEATRGVGFSFGYNGNEPASAFLRADSLVWLLADVVSKNGNLLLNVGPRADGTIQEEQRAPLLALGRWLAVHGPAIFGTRPWVEAEGRTREGAAVRFTATDSAVHAIVRGAPGATVTLEDVWAAPGTVVRLLGSSAPLRWTQRGRALAVQVPPEARVAATRAESTAIAFALSIGPRPWRLVRDRPAPGVERVGLPGLAEVP